MDRELTKPIYELLNITPQRFISIQELIMHELEPFIEVFIKSPFGSSAEVPSYMLAKLLELCKLHYKEKYLQAFLWNRAMLQVQVYIEFEEMQNPRSFINPN